MITCTHCQNGRIAGLKCAHCGGLARKMALATRVAPAAESLSLKLKRTLAFYAAWLITLLLLQGAILGLRVRLATVTMRLGMVRVQTKLEEAVSYLRLGLRFCFVAGRAATGIL